ncbi:hypothetical protein MC7420_5074 [Coleofasciculus chthonoplastes PCC 7420]|uniref:Uncharacterized protein n=1 Tax=Coleofasciculus chthonoplastes PCC 7420 TaxID=118168 RepID=B4W1G5_9CYAN|nr:hypothetical protein [Coleofasciculus chthonoplastes]EDX71930.1 hypothetical protein MC7420_5074 [Coleofasciculus chthonoplastes PCC 7420]
MSLEQAIAHSPINPTQTRSHARFILNSTHRRSLFDFYSFLRYRLDFGYDFRYYIIMEKYANL